MLFDNDNINFDLTFMNLANLNDNNFKSQNLCSIKEGFLKGNMFKDEYRPYKNYKYSMLSPKSEKEAKLYNIMAYSFAINDLNLYLDINPNDTEIVSLLEEFCKELKVLKEEFEKEYDALSISGVKGKEFTWATTNFPWDNDGGEQYV